MAAHSRPYQQLRRTFFRGRRISLLTSHESVTLFTALLTNCDSNGVTPARSSVLLAMFPEPWEVSGLVSASSLLASGLELESVGLVVRYEAEGSSWFAIVGYCDQLHRPDERSPEHPVPPGPDDTSRPDSSQAEAKPNASRKESERKPSLKGEGEGEVTEKEKEKKGRSRAGLDLPALIADLGTEATNYGTQTVLDAARAWVAYRRERKLRPWLEKTWRSRLPKALLAPDKFQASVKHSISNEYQGLFEPNTNGGLAVRSTSRNGVATDPEAAAYGAAEILRRKGLIDD